ncbi:MAG: guanylate kinase [Neisseriaceae bacterium]
MKKGRILFVISAPSGTGKTSLLQKVLEQDCSLSLAISHTSRIPRKGEVNGKSYHFITTKQFKALIEKNYFVEYACVHGNYYGTSWQEIEDTDVRNKNILLEIDVQGAAQIKLKYPQAVLIFIAPPSLEALQDRLYSRNSDATDTIQTRLTNARNEMRQAANFDYLVVNKNFERAVNDLRCIFRAEELAVSRNQDILSEISFTMKQ